MARVFAYRGFDQLNSDFSEIYFNALDYQFDNNINLDRDGQRLEDLLTVAYESGGELFGIGFAGSRFRMVGDRVTGGTLQVMAELWDVGGNYEEIWEIDGLNLALVDVYNATRTRSTADDARLVERMLSGNDRFDLSFESDRAFGMAGNDTLHGLGGDDTLGGGAGQDMLFGGRGNDRLMLDAGNDAIHGGAGQDWVVMQGRSAGRVDLAVTGRQDTRQGQDILSGIENASGGAGHDTLLGDAQANILQGGASNDLLSSRAGADRLLGMAGNDTLLGGAGNDTLIGGAQADVLTGGAGADIFVFRTLADSRVGQADLITDFRSGIDRIDLRPIDADGRSPGNQAFDVDGFGALQPGSPGQLVFRQIQTGGGRETQILLDTDGDGRAEGIIRLSGTLTLTESDFFL